MIDAQALLERVEATKARLAAAKPPGPPLVVRWLILFGSAIGATVAARIAVGGLLVPILAFIAGLVLGVVIVSRLVPRAPRRSRDTIGTRAWEAQHNLKLLEALTRSRRDELARTTEPAQRARLEREIAFLAAQVPEEQALLTSDEPGRGYVGVKSYQGD